MIRKHHTIAIAMIEKTEKILIVAGNV